MKVERRSAAFVALSLLISRSVVAVEMINTVGRAVKGSTGKSIN